MDDYLLIDNLIRLPSAITNMQGQTRKQFKRLLRDLSISTTGSIEQGIRDFISSWQGNTEQTDDILVMGIEFL